MNDKFLNLLQPVPDKGLLDFEGGELTLLKQYAHKNNLLMLLYAQLNKYEKECSPRKDIEELLAGLRSFYMKNMVRTVRHEEEARKVIEYLRNGDVPAVVLRGSRIANEIYGDPYCRISSDIDVLIRSSDMVKADQLFTEAGYARENSYPLAFWFQRIHHAVYRYPSIGTLIEIHWNFGIPTYFNITSEDIWSEIYLNEGGEFGLSPEIMMIHLLIHHFLHAFRELKILVDVLWAFKKYEDQIDWSCFTQKLIESGLVKTALITLSQVKALWKDAYLSVKAMQTVNKELNKAQCRVPSYLQSYFTFDTEREYVFQHPGDLLMARFVLDKWSRIIRSFIKILFPDVNSVKVFYGDTRNWMLPFNYAKFIIWRMKDWVG